MAFLRHIDTSSNPWHVEDPDPWGHAPDEAQVEWDRGVAPYLENMPEDTRIYWQCRTIDGHIYLSVSFAVTINNHTVFKSVLWTRPSEDCAGGWQSNYGKPSVAAELDWTDHPALAPAHQSGSS